MESGPLAVFVHWFQMVSASLNVKTQKQALNACHEVASSLLTDKWYDEGKSKIAEVAPAQRDTRKIVYSAEIREVGYTHRSGDQSRNQNRDQNTPREFAGGRQQHLD